MYMCVCVCFVDKTASVLFRSVTVSGYMRKL